MDIITISKDNVTHHQDDLHRAVKLYITIYSAPPYNEKFEFDAVLKEFYDYVNDGLLLLIVKEENKENNKVIGFLATSYGHSCDALLRKDLIDNNIDPDNDVYFSEFGVDIHYRCQGLGKLMVDRMFICHKDKQIYLRTAKHNNDKIIKYYTNVGFEVLDVVERVVNTRMNGTVEIDERVYMVKRH